MEEGGAVSGRERKGGEGRKKVVECKREIEDITCVVLIREAGKGRGKGEGKGREGKGREGRKERDGNKLVKEDRILRNR